MSAYLNLGQASEIMGVCRNTMKRHAKALGGVKVGRQWRFDPERLKLGSGPVLPKERQCHTNEVEVSSFISASRECEGLLGLRIQRTQKH